MPAQKPEDVDQLRAEYVIGDEIITVTQTVCIFSVAVRKLDPSVGVPIDPEQMARRIFSGAGKISLKTTSKNEDRREGLVQD